MSILVTCDCGRSVRVKDESAGRKFRCPACTAIVAVPRPDDIRAVKNEAYSPAVKALDRPAARANRQELRRLMRLPPAPLGSGRYPGSARQTGLGAQAGKDCHV